jgi:CDI immunity protein
MRPAQEPFKKTATIYKSEKFISVEPLSGANILKYLEDDDSARVFLEPDAADEILGRALLGALARSRFVEEREFFDPDRAMRAEVHRQNDAMRRYGYKTKRDVYQKLDWCIAKISDGKISIQPYRRYKPNYWKTLPADRTVVIPETHDAATAGAALNLALDRCEIARSALFP